MKEILAIGSMVILAISLTIGYNLYSDSRKREMYKLCLEASVNSPNKTAINFCSLGR